MAPLKESNWRSSRVTWALTTQLEAWLCRDNHPTVERWYAKDCIVFRRALRPTPGDDETSSNKRGSTPRVRLRNAGGVKNKRIHETFYIPVVPRMSVISWLTLFAKCWNPQAMHVTKIIFLKNFVEIRKWIFMITPCWSDKRKNVKRRDDSNRDVGSIFSVCRGLTLCR